MSDDIMKPLEDGAISDIMPPALHTAANTQILENKSTLTNTTPIDFSVIKPVRTRWWLLRTSSQLMDRYFVCTPSNTVRIQIGAPYKKTTLEIYLLGIVVDYAPYKKTTLEIYLLGIVVDYAPYKKQHWKSICWVL